MENVNFLISYLIDVHLAAAGERIGERKSGTKAAKVVLAVFPRLRPSFTALELPDYMITLLQLQARAQRRRKHTKHRIARVTSCARVKLL